VFKRGKKKTCDGGIAAADDSVYYRMMIPAIFTVFSGYEIN
jgi:hypothetical protein